MVGRTVLLGLLLAAAGLTGPGVAATPVAGAGHVLLEAEVEPARVYAQSQAVYTLRFYQAVAVDDLNIVGPSVSLADVRPIDEAHVHETTRNGIRYRVHERSYALFPFTSGALQITGAQALFRPTTAAVPSGGRSSERIEAAPVTLTVLPVPRRADTTPWLPARSLRLSETWSANPGGARVGEALQRSIRIDASGADAAQLPPLQVEAPGMTVFAEPARLENNYSGKLNVGSRIQTFRMVPIRAGEMLVPEIQMRWWDMDSNAPAIAKLPSRILPVAYADTRLTSAAPLPETVGALDGVLAPFLGIAMLSATAGFIYARRRRLGAVWRLRRSCRAGQAPAMRDALLAWAATVWPDTPPLTLGALSELVSDPSIRRAIEDIDRSLYGRLTDFPHVSPMSLVDQRATLLNHFAYDIWYYDKAGRDAFWVRQCRNV